MFRLFIRDITLPIRHMNGLQSAIESHQRERLKNETTGPSSVRRLLRGWSPELIAGRIREYHHEHKIGYEAIYQYIYAEAGFDPALPESTSSGRIAVIHVSTFRAIF